MRTVQLVVSDEFKDPIDFSTCTTAEAELILIGGYNACKFMRQNITIQMGEELNVAHKEEIARLKRGFDENYTAYQEELKRRNTTISDLRSEITRVANEADTLYSRKHQEEVQRLRSELIEVRDKLTLTEAEYRRELVSLVSSARQPKNLANTRGTIGENYVYEYLRNRFNNEECRCVMMSANPNSGDIWLTVRGVTILVEIKNKARNTLADIEKFTSNTLSAAVHCGLYISLDDTVIPNHGSFSIDIKYPKPMIYTYHVCDELIYNSVQMLLRLFERSEDDRDVAYTQLKSVVHQLDDTIGEGMAMVEANIKTARELCAGLERTKTMIGYQTKLICDLYLEHPSVKLSDELKYSVLPDRIVAAVVEKYNSAARPLADAEIFTASGKSARYFSIYGGVGELKRMILANPAYTSVHKYVNESYSVPGVGFDINHCNGLYQTNAGFKTLIDQILALMHAGRGAGALTAESLSVYGIAGITKNPASYKTTFGISITDIKRYAKIVYDNYLVQSGKNG